MLKRFTFLLRTMPVAALAAALLWLTPAAAGEIPYGQGLLWRVERDGGGPASYVFGSFHSTDARLRKLAPAVDQAFSQARVAVFELIDSDESTAKMARALPLPVGSRLEDILGPERFQRTVAAVAPLGVPAEGLQNLKPWALSL